ncbi:MAG: hypothetical protein OXU81_15740 [Gammaproteobacteria bacterium]|nr:hypothetical protein [Gammaproteobacteria bacterium]
MKAKCWIAAAGMAVALALFGGNAQATDDQTTYRFRVVNNFKKAIYMRCGSSGDWTRVAIGWSRDMTCSQSTAQTKVGEGNAVDWNHDCSADRPVKFIRYYKYGYGTALAITEGCRAP